MFCADLTSQSVETPEHISHYYDVVTLYEVYFSIFNSVYLLKFVCLGFFVCVFVCCFIIIYLFLLGIWLCAEMLK